MEYALQIHSLIVNRVLVLLIANSAEFLHDLAFCFISLSEDVKVSTRHSVWRWATVCGLAVGTSARVARQERKPPVRTTLV
jgi:hypothetical protein